jgi:hypothetical protein
MEPCPYISYEEEGPGGNLKKRMLEKFIFLAFFFLNSPPFFFINCRGARGHKNMLEA